MKKIVLALVLALGSQFAVAEEPKEKTRVCVDVKDKEGKDVIMQKPKKSNKTAKKSRYTRN